MDNRLIETQIRQDLQKTLPEDLKSLMVAPSTLSGSSRVLWQVSLLFFIPILFSYLFQDAAYDTRIFLYALAGLGIATRLRALTLILHDAVHYSVTRSRKVNRFLGRVSSLFTHVSFETYSHRHLNHHRFVGDTKNDQDFGYEIQKVLSEVAKARSMTAEQAGQILRLFFASIHIDLFASKEPAHWQVARVFVFVSALIAAVAADSFLAATMFVVLPVFIFFPALQILGDFYEHGYLAWQNSGLRSRNHQGVNKFVDWTLFSHNDEYHLIHHLVPSAPGHILPRLHQHLLQHSQIYRLQIQTATDVVTNTETSYEASYR